MKLIIMGLPEAGEGTYAINTPQRLGVPWISTGSTLRHHKTAQIDFSKLIASYIDRDEFVPDRVINRIAYGRLE